MTFLSTRSWSIFCFFGMLLLTGCGFHLRKGITFSNVIQPIYIDAAAPNSPLVQLIENQLKANGIALTSSNKMAKLILYISKIQSDTELTSLRGGSEAGQYTVTTSVTISAAGSNGRILIKPNTITQQRTYSSNATQTLSSDYMSNNIISEMQQSLANQVLSQIVAINAIIKTAPAIKIHRHHEAQLNTRYHSN